MSSAAGGSCPPDIPEDVYHRQLYGVIPTTITLILSLSTYGLRIVARAKTNQSLRWDDYFMGVGLLISLEPAICQYLREDPVDPIYRMIHSC
jgi:hypothetical protein